MNPLLKFYADSLDYPEVSGAELLELLTIRDQLAQLIDRFNALDQTLLLKADLKLLLNASVIYPEISRFINLETYRKENQITPEKWWWYIDVLDHLPLSSLQTAA
ncbi:hypothetical protein AWQ21_10215 [Picosynechococcus sp. PCC 7003]|uniref:hypothetical protein n=1 Tax=Picosynechococcus sp. PCC 7003 TaxID=374981 RepID=UPI000810DD76|nr:hypothetical protein [Picosynechococcus sp. PCC 7003]ANV84721.1 hypothetical protein AWQ21_10215 [Picosynechococcus sp. PCC 7003]